MVTNHRRGLSAACLRAFLGLLVCVVFAPAHAQTIYRCGPGGKVYSQTACPEGQAIALRGAVSGSRQAQAIEIARRDQRLATTMSEANAKRAREQAPPTTAGNIPVRELAVGQDKGASNVSQPNKPKKNEDFKALVPKADASKLKPYSPPARY